MINTLGIVIDMILMDIFATIYAIKTVNIPK
jgi:hypothetical protein